MRTAADVAIVGGGPAGAVASILLARDGIDVLVLERNPTWRWRACGVFASPAALARLGRLGLDGPGVRTAARPIPAMRVEPIDGPSFRLTYGADGSADQTAVGFDRATLDPTLLDAARLAGADVREGIAVIGVESGHGGPIVRHHTGTIRARVVVGADGIRSTVARSVGARRPARNAPRIGLTFHVDDPRANERRDARMRILRDGYVGLAPVPGRVNVGIVLGDTWRADLRRQGAAAVAAEVLRSTPPNEDDDASWRHGQPCDAVVGASPVGHRVGRRSGPDWILVGDAAGFLDPFTGEGLHRAIVTAELGARAISAHLAGRPDTLAEYGRAVARRFRGKDLVTHVVQLFLARPALFGYASRRLSARDQVRETMGLVIGDLVPASRAMDPRYLAALLAP